MKSKISRRDFIKGSAASAISIGAMSILGGCAETECPEVETPVCEPTTVANTGDVVTAETFNKKWSFEVAPDPIAEDKIAETITADVIVVGCGISGLMTACTAKESGLNVVIVSASKAPVSRGGSNNAVYSKCMERLGIEKQDINHFKKEIFYSCLDVDQQKWYKYYNTSEEAMNWAIDLMESKGYDTFIEPATKFKKDSLFHIPDASHGFTDHKDYTQVGMTQPLFANTLADHFTSLGGTIYFSTKGEQLVREDGGKGRVDAVICSREDGTYAKYVGTKAVVLATGDFSADRDMMHKYCPTFADKIEDSVYDGETNYDVSFAYGGLYKGDGHKMGLWAGAAWQRTFPNCVMGFSPLAGATISYGTHWGLMLDRTGKRFMDEYSLVPPAGMVQRHLPGGEAFAIWDMNYARKIGASSGWMMESGYGNIKEKTDDEREKEAAEIWDQKVKQGEFVKGDTIEEVIDALGLPKAETLATIERYNEFARNGKDEEFYKDPSVLLEINNGPFYGAKNNPNMFVFLTVLGGLRTNINMQVCDENDVAIPGLYNVGTMVGDVFATNYSFMAEAAKMLRMNRRYIYELIKNNKIKAVKQGNRYRISVDSVNSYIKYRRCVYLAYAVLMVSIMFLSYYIFSNYVW